MECISWRMRRLDPYRLVLGLYWRDPVNFMEINIHWS